MVNIDDFKRLHALGWPAKDVARRLGISRARVYQLAKKHGLLFAGQEAAKERKRPFKAPRVTAAELASVERKARLLVASIAALRKKLIGWK